MRKDGEGLQEGPRRRRLYVVGRQLDYFAPWAPEFELEMNPARAEVAMFTGGADISPQLYGEEDLHCGGIDKHRDEYEVNAFSVFSEKKIPLIGICRGAQFLTAMNGGKLYQHVNNHGLRGGHEIVTKTGEHYFMSSAHHQMMRPRGEFEIIAWTPLRSNLYLSGNRKEGVKSEREIDPEIVWYPKTRALCIQGHPEYMENDHPTNEYLRRLAVNLLFPQ